MINKADIMNNIITHQGQFQVPILITRKQKRMFAKVIRLYLKFMFEAIFEGYRWHIFRIGDFQLETVPSDSKRLKPFVDFYRDDVIRRNERYFNPKMPAEIIQMKVTSPFLKKEKCRFRPSKSFRDRLSKKLFEEGNFLKNQENVHK